jgi:hypothetical protein
VVTCSLKYTTAVKCHLVYGCGVSICTDTIGSTYGSYGSAVNIDIYAYMKVCSLKFVVLKYYKSANNGQVNYITKQTNK